MAALRFFIPDLDALPKVAQEVIDALGDCRKVVLYGEMGAGKTTFTTAFCHQLGVEDPPSSPTYSLINEYAYRTPDGQEGLIHHLDLYRLKTAEEALDIGIEDVLYDPWWCLIEWPQLIEPWLPQPFARIDLEALPSGGRLLELTLYR